MVVKSIGSFLSATKRSYKHTSQLMFFFSYRVTVLFASLIGCMCVLCLPFFLILGLSISVKAIEQDHFAPFLLLTGVHFIQTCLSCLKDLFVYHALKTCLSCCLKTALLLLIVYTVYLYYLGSNCATSTNGPHHCFVHYALALLETTTPCA